MVVDDGDPDHGDVSEGRMTNTRRRRCPRLTALPGLVRRSVGSLPAMVCLHALRRTEPMDPPHTPSPGDEKASFAELLSGLHAELRHGLRAPTQGHAATRRRMLLRLEQMWKIETQLLLPALTDQGAVQPALQEVELLRDAALLFERSAPDLSDIAWSVVQRLAELHLGRIDGLMQCASASPADWLALRDEASAWLSRWAAEIRAHGDIEDEDRDPVGLPPR